MCGYGAYEDHGVKIFIEKFTFEYIKDDPEFLSGSKYKDIRSLHCLKEVQLSMILFSSWMSGSQRYRVPQKDGAISKKNVINNVRRLITNFIA
jgi:hypothetical protein